MTRANRARLVGAVALALLASASCAFAAEPTAETNERLKTLLQRFPKADLDGDGVLTQSEAREARERLRKERGGSQAAACGPRARCHGRQGDLVLDRAAAPSA